MVADVKQISVHCVTVAETFNSFAYFLFLPVNDCLTAKSIFADCLSFPGDSCQDCFSRNIC